MVEEPNECWLVVKLELCSGLQNKHMSDRGWWHNIQYVWQAEARLMGMVCMPEILETVWQDEGNQHFSSWIYLFTQSYDRTKY